jgi:hypothetical protein
VCSATAADSSKKKTSQKWEEENESQKWEREERKEGKNKNMRREKYGWHCVAASVYTSASAN